MKFEDIFEDFARSETVPAAAVEACLKEPQVPLEHTIGVLTRLVADKDLIDESVSYEEHTTLIIFLLVLAELKEKSLFEPLLKLLACDEVMIDELFADHLTETIPSILISTFDGDPNKLVALMDDSNAYAYCRDSAFRAWSYLAATGVIPREEAKRSLTSRFKGLKDEFDPCLWASWIESVMVNGFSDLCPMVKELLNDQRMIEANYTTYDYFFGELEERLNTHDLDKFLRDKYLRPHENTIEELSHWYRSSEESRQEMRRRSLAKLSPSTIINPYRNIGRNDPCYCGSGKKFKKCCLH